MTLREVSTQLFNLTDGRVNGERYTETQLERAIRAWMRGSERHALKNRYVITITLADGTWPATIDKFRESADGYDYWIPDTMAEAESFWKRFLDAAC